MDFALPPGIAELETELLRFAEHELRPKMREFEAAGAWDESVAKTLDGFALRGLDLPETGAGALAKSVALEAVAFGDAGGLPLFDSSGPAAGAILAAGESPGERCALVLGPPARAEWVPGAEPPPWTFAVDGERLLLLDSASCPASPAGAAAFHASGGVSVDLSGAARAREWTLGPDAALVLRGRARLWYASVALGVARASLDYAVAYAKERVVMGKPVAHHQGNAFAIAEAWADLDAARLAVRAAARRLDDGAAEAGLWATLASLDATEAAVAVTDLGVQLLGGHGYIEDHPVEKWFREARMLGLLFGGRDAALDDAAAGALDAPDPEMG